MTNQTIAAVKQELLAKIEAVMLSGKGQLITFSPKALQQAMDIMELMKDVTQYDESKFVLEDFDAARTWANIFDTRFINGEVIDNVVQPISDELAAAALADAREGFKTFPTSHLILVALLGEALNKHQHFYR